MTPDVPSLAQRLVAARRLLTATDMAYSDARQALLELEAEEAEELAKRRLADALEAGPLSAHLQGELVADAARDHSGARIRGSNPEGTWRAFRAMLAGLVARADAAEQSLRERVAEREALCERVSLLEEATGGARVYLEMGKRIRELKARVTRCDQRVVELEDAIDRETITHDGEPADVFSEGALGRLREARRGTR